MSCVVDFAETFSQGASLLSGFDVVGLDKTENIVQDAGEYESIASGGFQDLREDNYEYNFVEGVYEHEYTYSFEEVSEGVSQDVDSELGETSEVEAETSGGDNIDLEFFNDGINTFGDLTDGGDNPIFQGIGENPSVEFDEQSGTLSIDGREIAQLDFNLDSQDDNYEIF